MDEAKSLYETGIRVKPEELMERDVEFKSDGSVNEDKSMSMMLYDVRCMIREINNFVKKSRYRSLAVTELEKVEHWMQKDLETK